MVKIMNEIFVRDWLEAREAEKELRTAVLQHQATYRDARFILQEKVRYLKNDIKNMSEDGWKKLQNEEVTADQKEKEQIQKFKSMFVEGDDPISEDNWNQNIEKIRLDALGIKISIITRIGYGMGWLE
jgi:predicted secreted protein